MIRVFLFGLLLIGSSACAQADTSKVVFNTQQELIISEFEGFQELELIDCLIGWDTAIYQAEQGQIELENIPAQKAVVNLMSEALIRKKGESVDVKKLRTHSSFHISGLYFSEPKEHADYQEKIMSSCVKQMTRITNKANSKGVQ